MGFIANTFGKMWVKSLYKDKTPKYGPKGKETFGQYVDGANGRIKENQKVITDCDTEITDIIEESIGKRFAIVMTECNNYPEKAWAMWWRIRWIEAKYGVDRETAHQTVRNQAKQGVFMDSKKCYEEIMEMIDRHENTIHADAKR